MLLKPNSRRRIINTLIERLRGHYNTTMNRFALEASDELERQAKEIEALQLELDGAHSELRRQARHKLWVGLTDEEVEQVFPAIATYHAANKTLYRSIARAIEDKLKEKNYG